MKEQREAHLERGLLEHARHAVELYDVELDPDCLDDLARVRPEVTSSLRARIVEWLTDAPAERWAASPSGINMGTLAQLAELGYAAGDGQAADSALFDVDCACSECAAYR